MIPGHSRYVIVGAGIHGLSTAWHLAGELRRRGLGGGEDILVLDKRGVGAGVSGVACGVIENNYFQPAMRKLMAHSVGVWESDPDAFAYHPVGYLQIAPEAMHADVAKIFAEQQAIGYPSVLVEGERDCRAYMLALFGDWRAPGTTAILHEQRGGYANNVRSLRGLSAKAEAEGVRIATGVTVTGIGTSGGAVTAVETDQGVVGCEQLVIMAGPGPRPVGHARPAVAHPGYGARRRRARRPADVDLLGAAGGDAGGSPGGVHHHTRARAMSSAAARSRFATRRTPMRCSSGSRPSIAGGSTSCS